MPTWWVLGVWGTWVMRGEGAPCMPTWWVLVCGCLWGGHACIHTWVTWGGGDAYKAACVCISCVTWLCDLCLPACLICVTWLCDLVV